MGKGGGIAPRLHNSSMQIMLEQMSTLEISILN